MARRRLSDNLRQLGPAETMFVTRTGPSLSAHPLSLLGGGAPGLLCDPKVLLCPSDPSFGRTSGGLTNDLPHSFIINAWNDNFLTVFWPRTSSGMSIWLRGPPRGCTKGVVMEPSDTILFVEKVSDRSHWYMDFTQGHGNDFEMVEQGRHGRGPTGTARAGPISPSATAARDSSAAGRSVSPINLWA